jgi:hypothetical protein
MLYTQLCAQFNKVALTSLADAFVTGTVQTLQHDNSKGDSDIA